MPRKAREYAFTEEQQETVGKLYRAARQVASDLPEDERELAAVALLHYASTIAGFVGVLGVQIIRPEEVEQAGFDGGASLPRAAAA